MNLEAQEPSGLKFWITRRERVHVRQESVGSCVIAPLYRGSCRVRRRYTATSEERRFRIVTTSVTVGTSA